MAPTPTIPVDEGLCTMLILPALLWPAQEQDAARGDDLNVVAIR
jgi:hypothetical protein